MPAGVGAADGVEHRQVGRDVGEQPVDQSVGRHAEQYREALLEGRLVDLALLQGDQQLARLGVFAEAPGQELGVDLGTQSNRRGTRRTGSS